MHGVAASSDMARWACKLAQAGGGSRGEGAGDGVSPHKVSTLTSVLPWDGGGVVALSSSPAIWLRPVGVLGQVKAAEVCLGPGPDGWGAVPLASD